MIILILFFMFLFDVKAEELEKMREGLNSKDDIIFTQCVEKVIKIEKEELPEDFKKFLILKAIEKFDEELFPLKKESIFKYLTDFLKTFLGNPKKDYHYSIICLFHYVSAFSNSGYEEEILNRFVTKELIKANTNKVIDIIKKREKEVIQNENLRKAIYLLLSLSNKKIINIENQDQNYLKDVFENMYNNLGEKGKCENFSENSEILKEVYSIGDEKIIKDAKICICKEKEFGDVLTYYFGLLELNVNGADKLINECLGNIKDEKIKDILKRMLNDYHNSIPFKINEEEFKYLSKNTAFKNPCCK